MAKETLENIIRRQLELEPLVDSVGTNVKDIIRGVDVNVRGDELNVLGYTLNYIGDAFDFHYQEQRYVVPAPRNALGKGIRQLVVASSRVLTHIYQLNNPRKKAPFEQFKDELKKQLLNSITPSDVLKDNQDPMYDPNFNYLFNKITGSNNMVIESLSKRLYEVGLEGASAFVSSEARKGSGAADERY